MIDEPFAYIGLGIIVLQIACILIGGTLENRRRAMRPPRNEDGFGF